MKKSAILMSLVLMLGIFAPVLATETLPGPPEKTILPVKLQKEKAKEVQSTLPAAPEPGTTNKDAAAADQQHHGSGVIIISGTTLLIIIILLIILL
jgi:hypothetical protein